MKTEAEYAAELRKLESARDACMGWLYRSILQDQIDALSDERARAQLNESAPAPPVAAAAPPFKLEVKRPSDYARGLCEGLAIARACVGGFDGLSLEAAGREVAARIRAAEGGEDV